MTDAVSVYLVDNISLSVAVLESGWVDRPALGYGADQRVRLSGVGALDCAGRGDAYAVDAAIRDRGRGGGKVHDEGAVVLSRVRPLLLGCISVS